MVVEKDHPRWRKKRVDKKVVPFVKLVGLMESPRREDKENGLTLFRSMHIVDRTRMGRRRPFCSSRDLHPGLSVREEGLKQGVGWF